MFAEYDPQIIAQKVNNLQNIMKTVEICFNTNPLEYQSTEEAKKKYFDTKIFSDSASFFLSEKNFSRAEIEVDRGLVLANELLLK
jgi:hypothetical protein